jgi:hypothetical protein
MSPGRMRVRHWYARHAIHTGHSTLSPPVRHGTGGDDSPTLWHMHKEARLLPRSADTVAEGEL